MSAESYRASCLGCGHRNGTATAAKNQPMRTGSPSVPALRSAQFRSERIPSTVGFTSFSLDDKSSRRRRAALTIASLTHHLAYGLAFPFIGGKAAYLLELRYC